MNLSTSMHTFYRYWTKPFYMNVRSFVFPLTPQVGWADLKPSCVFCFQVSPSCSSCKCYLTWKPGKIVIDFLSNRQRTTNIGIHFLIWEAGLLQVGPWLRECCFKSGEKFFGQWLLAQEFSAMFFEACKHFLFMVHKCQDPFPHPHRFIDTN